MFINYFHYNGGTNNLCVVSDNKGRYASSLKGCDAAIKNFNRKYRKCIQAESEVKCGKMKKR